MDVANGYDGGVLRIFFSTDDGLDLGDVKSGEGDGIAAKFGRRAVAADALNIDVD